MFKKDVIVIGAGLAGMVAALEAYIQGSKVVLITKGPLGLGSNSALSGARFAGSNPRYLSRTHQRYFKQGKVTNQQDYVKQSSFMFLALTENCMGTIDPNIKHPCNLETFAEEPERRNYARTNHL
jgi:glycine/D-amino acid oxidase-like deaminating enzyme